MPNLEITKLTVPVDVSGVVTNVTYDIKDATARQMIADLGKALYWVGVTTDELTDGATTNPITVGGESVTVHAGGVAQYMTVEYAFDGTNWQKLGEGNLGDLAYQNTASAYYTPTGSVTVNNGKDTTATVNSITAIGSLPSFSYDSANEALTFSAGTLPTKGADQTVVTASGTRTATFAGTQDTITVS